MRKYWKSVKAWFKFSETIAWSRMDVLIGFVLSAIAMMDWSPLLSLDFSTGFNNDQIYGIAALCIGHGLVGEWLRRRNATFHNPEDN